MGRNAVCGLIFCSDEPDYSSFDYRDEKIQDSGFSSVRENAEEDEGIGGGNYGIHIAGVSAIFSYSMVFLSHAARQIPDSLASSGKLCISGQL